MNGHRIVTAALLATCALPAQVEWQVEDPRTRASVVVDRRVDVPPKTVVQTPAGQARVDFPFDADGKPLSLSFDVEQGDRVVVATSRAGPRAARSVDVFGDGGADVELTAKVRDVPLQARTTGERDAEATDYRVTAVVRPRQKGVFGIVARHRADAGCYLLSIDWQTKVLRLERWMGSDHVVIRQQQLAIDWADAHTLALQCEGFRLQAFVDDGLVLQSFDGALRRGSYGLAWLGERGEPVEVSVDEPAEPRESIAVVQRRGGATIHARTMVPPGNVFAVELRLDRPHVALPLDLAGCEPPLSQPPVAPIVLLAEPGEGLIEGGLGVVPSSGELLAELRWERQPMLWKEVALARVLFVSARGDYLHGATAPARVIF